MAYTRRGRSNYSTTFIATGTPRQAPWSSSMMETPYAEVTMRRGGFVNHFRNVGGESGVPSSVVPTPFNAGNSAAFPKRKGQGTLFSAVPSEVETAFSDPSMRHTVPTLLGLAVRESQQIGTGLMGSSDLSRHSSPLVQRGLKAKLLLPNPGNRQGRRTNLLGFASLSVAHAAGEVPPLAAGGEMVTDEEVADAKSTIRGVLRPQPTQSAVLRKMSAPDRRMYQWHNANSADPDRPNTAGAGERLPLGHQFNPEAQANQHAWLQKHYGDNEQPAVSHAEQQRLEQEVSTGYRAKHTPGYVQADRFFVSEANRLSDKEISERSARLRDHTTSKTVMRPEPPDEPSDSKKEWLESAPKPGKGQKRLL